MEIVLYLCFGNCELEFFISDRKPDCNRIKILDNKMNALGRHILAEFYSCTSKALDDTSGIEALMVEAANKAGATIINSSFHHFSPAGVSGVVVIQESHLAIHTWPEYRFAAVDIFTCGREADPQAALDYLKHKLQAARVEMREESRGLFERLDSKVSRASVSNIRKKFAGEMSSRSVWFTSKDENLALSLRLKGRTLYDKSSAYQRVRVFDTFGFGRVLAIDNMIVCTERDEAFYHEMICHPAMLAHGRVKEVLIIGGGDGGTAREVLKHEVDRVTLVEIDENVVEAARQFLPTLSSSFDDIRMNLIIDDGTKYINSVDDSSLDLIIVDGSDPVGPSQGLFTAEFYRNCFRKLKPDGMLVTQGESPDFNRQVFVELNTCLRSIFVEDKVNVLLFHITTYPAGIWSFHIAQKGNQELVQVDPLEIESFVKSHELKFYNAEIHRGAFSLPTYVRKMLKLDSF